MKMNAAVAVIGAIVVLVFLAASGIVEGSICMRNIGCGVADTNGLKIESWSQAGAAVR